MNRSSKRVIEVLAWTSVGGVAALLSGCFSFSNLGMPYASGAQQVFTQDQSCPADRVTVVPRPDVAPHTLFPQNAATPPAAIAADPARLQVWTAQNGQDNAAIDAAWSTFQATGCGVVTMYACNHPSPVDAQTGQGRVVGDWSMTLSDGTGTHVLSAVQCQAASTQNQLAVSAGPQGDINARMDAPDVPKLALHTAMPAMPAALKGLRVLNTERPHTGVTAAACHTLGQAFDAQIGWTPVEASAPHDIVMLSDCFNAAFVTHGERMFELGPLDLTATLTLSAPDGTVIDTLPPFPSTMACPGTDQIQCNASFGEFAAATMAGGIAGSTKLQDFVNRRGQRPRRSE